MSNYTREYYKRSSHIIRNNSYKRLYGISLADYDSLLFKQEHRCGMCKRHVSELRFKLAIDHCHTTGKVRGLLCTKCNAHLGIYEDKVFMKMCEDYLCHK